MPLCSFLSCLQQFNSVWDLMDYFHWVRNHDFSWYNPAHWSKWTLTAICQLKHREELLLKKKTKKQKKPFYCILSMKMYVLWNSEAVRCLAVCTSITVLTKVKWKSNRALSAGGVMAGLRPCFRLTGEMIDSGLGDWYSDAVTRDSLSASAETENR